MGERVCVLFVVQPSHCVGNRGVGRLLFARSLGMAERHIKIPALIGEQPGQVIGRRREFVIQRKDLSITGFVVLFLLFVNDAKHHVRLNGFRFLGENGFVFCGRLVRLAGFELEQAIPARLALSSVQFDAGGAVVHLTGTAMSLEDITAFTVGLQDHPMFKDPVLAQHRAGANGLVEFNVTLRYRQIGT